MATSYYKLYKTDVDNDYFWVKNESPMKATVKLQVNGSKPTFVSDNVIGYSRDKVTWENTEWTLNENISLDPYQKIYLRSSGGWSKSTSNYITIQSNRVYSIGGPLAALIDYTDMEHVTSVPDWCFMGLCTSQGSRSEDLNTKYLVDISQIDFGNITTIGEGSFYQAFFVSSSSGGECNIKTLPDLSGITTIGRQGMWQMFTGAASLTGKLSMPNLTSIGFGGLETAFSRTNFTEAPDFSSLATIGEEGLFHTFEYNNNMKGQPIMSNVTSIGDKAMNQCFYNNYQLDKGADLSSCTSVGTQSFQNCYHYCNKLEEVTAPNISSWDTNIFYNWLSVTWSSGSGTRTFYAPTGLSIPTDSPSGIPAGWTRVDY